MFQYKATSDPSVALPSVAAKLLIELLAGSVVSQTPLNVVEPSGLAAMAKSSASCVGPAGQRRCRH